MELDYVENVIKQSSKNYQVSKIKYVVRSSMHHKMPVW